MIQHGMLWIKLKVDEQRALSSNTRNARINPRNVKDAFGINNDFDWLGSFIE